MSWMQGFWQIAKRLFHVRSKNETTKMLPEARLQAISVPHYQLRSEERYTFVFTNKQGMLRATFYTYVSPKCNTFTARNCRYDNVNQYQYQDRDTQYIFGESFNSVWKIYVDFQCLPKELNDIINEYY